MDGGWGGCAAVVSHQSSVVSRCAGAGCAVQLSVASSQPLRWRCRWVCFVVYVRMVGPLFEAGCARWRRFGDRRLQGLVALASDHTYTIREHPCPSVEKH